MSASYYLESTLPGNPRVGVSPMIREDQPVMLNGRVSNWLAAPEIVYGGPTRLGVGRYPATYQEGDRVIASHEPERAQDWYLVLINQEEGTFRIANDPTGYHVWTANEGPNPLITIEELRNDNPNPAQTFRFVARSR